MQEPQYGADEIAELLKEIGLSKKPCMSIMNMPPLPYIARIEGLDTSKLDGAYTKPDVWKYFDSNYMTLCSPDPQAFRPPDENINVLQVGLPTNFKAARFESDQHTQILRDLQSDLENIKYDLDGDMIDLPVKLKVHDSIFVPLAKWSMLLSGNYRCVKEEKAVAIKDQWNPTFEDCYEYCLPQRESFYSETIGRSRNDRIFDETAVVGVQEFASRLQAGIVPNFARWADLVAGSEVPEESQKDVNELLDNVTELSLIHI
mgnify:CR=1 FL=1